MATLAGCPIIFMRPTGPATIEEMVAGFRSWVPPAFLSPRRDHKRPGLPSIGEHV
jgi:hypothetical protein